MNAFDIFLRFYLIGQMVFFWPGHMAYVPQEMFFQFSAMVFLALSFLTPPRRIISNKYLGLLLFYAIAHTLILSFHDYSQNAILNVFFGFFMIKVIAERIDLNFRKIGDVFTLFAVANVVLLCFQMFDMDPVFSSAFAENKPEVDLVGFMGIKYALGSFAALSLPFVYASGRFRVIILLPLLWFSQSSTCILAFFIAFLFIFYFEHKKLFWLALIVLGSVASIYILFVDFPTGQFEKRLKVWFAGLRYLSGSQAWFGLGLGKWAVTGFRTIQQNGEPELWAWAHNEFLQFLFEQGVLGALFLYAYFKNLFRNISFSTQAHVFAVSAFLSLCVVSFFHFPFHVARFVGLSILAIASVEAVMETNNEEYSCSTVDCY